MSDHMWPDERDDTETRFGITWCRRCGRMLAADRRPGFEQLKPCRTVRVTTRNGT